MTKHVATMRKYPEIQIEPFQSRNTATITAFVDALQNYERELVPELKPGGEISQPYVRLLIRNVADRNGMILVAKAETEIVGFVCAWIEHDPDMLLQEHARQHALISDVFVSAGWRRRGIAHALLRAAENQMRERGCHRIRICSKAANIAAVTCYQHAGYQPYEIIFSKAIRAQADDND
jgi:ribosomal protein S18 acetylase RimI-like enzyme